MRFCFVSIGTDAKRHTVTWRCCTPLLQGVRDLVRQDAVTDQGPGPVLPLREHDVVAERVCERAHRSGRLRSRPIPVNADPAEILAEARLEPAPQVVWQWMS